MDIDQQPTDFYTTCIGREDTVASLYVVVAGKDYDKPGKPVLYICYKLSL